MNGNLLGGLGPASLGIQNWAPSIPKERIESRIHKGSWNPHEISKDWLPPKLIQSTYLKPEIHVSKSFFGICSSNFGGVSKKIMWQKFQLGPLCVFLTLLL